MYNKHYENLPPDYDFLGKEMHDEITSYGNLTSINKIILKYEKQIDRLIVAELDAMYKTKFEKKIMISPSNDKQQNFDTFYSYLEERYQNIIADMEKEVSEKIEEYVKLTYPITRGISYKEAEDRIIRFKQMYEDTILRGPSRPKSFPRFFVEDILPILLMKIAT
jgi:hypothetical protein